MDDTNETIADIIAEMRGMGNYQRYSGDHARVLANRLEAAHKRERGDCAKMREALVEIRKELYLCATGVDMQDFAHLHEAMLEDPPEYKDLRDSFFAIAHVVDAALAAPARNCDRPECATTKAAQEVWRREDGGKTAYYEWLLATATEKEGENDGR